MAALTVLGDWGTTRLRLYLTQNGTILDRVSGTGIGQLTLSPAETLAETLAPWRDRAIGQVLLCGMAGSRNGIVEVPYVAAPADRPAWAAQLGAFDLNGIPVRVASGLSGANFLGAPDVMRGEEAQIFGAVARDPDLATGRAMLILPGTHSKWAEVVDGRIERFHTFFTGESFALLRDHSTLTRAGTDAFGREEGFIAGLERARTGGALLGAVFEARAAQLVEGRSQGWAIGFLSGLLIGTEIREALSLATRELGKIAIVGDVALSALYIQALTAFGHQGHYLDGDDCVLEGLIALAATLENDA